MSNVVKFPGYSMSRDQERPPAFSAPTGAKGYVRRNRRSPHRKLWYRTEMAFVELNKVDHEHTPSEQETIRKGVEAAQTLAKEMVRAAERILPKQRRTNSEATAHRREFKEAMRRRIREIAASRDLPDEEIKPALTLKHHEIANFTEKHGVNVEWLLEGKGRIFKKDPIRVSPNMSGNEFAAVVATMPEADQQEIRATVREILQERDQ